MKNLLAIGLFLAGCVVSHAQGLFSYVTLQNQASTPATPTLSGIFYVNASNQPVFLNSAGAQTILGSAIWGSITGPLSNQTDLQTALNLLAPLASPALTGTPTAPTAAVGTNTTQLATMAALQAAAPLGITAPIALTESGGAVTINCALVPQSGGVFTLTLNAALTSVTFSNFSSGQSFTVRVGDTTSNYAVTWGNSIIWQGASSVQPTQTTGAYHDFWSFKKVGTEIDGFVLQVFAGT